MESARIMAQSLPNASLVLVPGAGTIRRSSGRRVLQRSRIFWQAATSPARVAGESAYAAVHSCCPCLLPVGLIKAAATTVDIATPMPAPEWAKLQRRILADQRAAAKAFFAKVYDERGYSGTSCAGAPTTGRTMPSRTPRAGRNCMHWVRATRILSCI